MATTYPYNQSHFARRARHFIALFTGVHGNDGCGTVEDINSHTYRSRIAALFGIEKRAFSVGLLYGAEN
jgi:hypothetical protein